MGAAFLSPQPLSLRLICVEMESQKEIDALVSEAGEAVLRPEAIEAFVARLPECDEVLASALIESAEKRNVRAFQMLYFAAFTGKRPVPAAALVEGAALIEDARLMISTLLHTQGNVVGALIEAVQRGRLSAERESICLMLAWMVCHEEEMEAPHALLDQTRKKIRQALRNRSVVALLQYEAIPEFTDDPVIAALTKCVGRDTEGVKAGLTKFRRQAMELPWNVAAVTDPSSSGQVHSGSTLIREAPRVGRNDPCPCGSGKKHKKCCWGQTGGFDDYSADGVKISELKIAPELGLTHSKIGTMRSYELWNLRPEKIPPSLRIAVARRLILFQDFERAREVLEAQAPEDYASIDLGDLQFHFLENESGTFQHLRWFVDWAKDAIDIAFEMEVAVADREKRVSMLVQKADEAFVATRTEDTFARVYYTELAQAAFHLSKPLGILVARGALKDAESIHHEVILDQIEDARDELGLPGEDQAIRLSQAIIDDEDIHFETSHALSKQQAKAKRVIEDQEQLAAKLEARIIELEKDLEEEAESEPRVPDGATAIPDPAPSHSDVEIQERLAEIKRLKANLKVEHDEHQRLRRELKAAQEKLSISQEAEPAAEESAQADPEALHLEPVPERVRARVCLPEFAPALREAMEKVPDSLAAQVVSIAGRLAAGDKHAWNGCRHLKQTDGLMRQRIGRSHRLFFRCREKTLEFVGLIHRQDFETWIRKHQQA